MTSTSGLGGSDFTLGAIQGGIERAQMGRGEGVGVNFVPPCIRIGGGDRRNPSAKAASRMIRPMSSRISSPNGVHSPVKVTPLPCQKTSPGSMSRVNQPNNFDGGRLVEPVAENQAITDLQAGLFGVGGRDDGFELDIVHDAWGVWRNRAFRRIEHLRPAPGFRLKTSSRGQSCRECNNDRQSCRPTAYWWSAARLARSRNCKFSPTSEPPPARPRG